MIPKRHFKMRMCEHLGILTLTGKRVNGDDDSAIKEHRLFFLRSHYQQERLQIYLNVKSSNQ